MNKRGSFSAEGIICVFVFLVFMIFASMFLKTMWVQSVVDDALSGSAKIISVATPVDRYGMIGKIAFNMPLKNIFIREIEENGYDLDFLGIDEESLSLKYSDFDKSDGLIEITAKYRTSLKIKGLENINNERHIVFSRVNFEMKFADADKLGNTVYITKTGARYHRANCRYLYKSKIPISEEEAKKRGYTPCKVCFGGN